MVSLKLRDIKLPVILVLQIIFCLCFGSFVPLAVKSFFYALSLTLKGVLMMVLPFVIFAFITKSIADLGRGAVGYIFSLFGLVCVSNFLATCLSGTIGALVVRNSVSLHTLEAAKNLLEPTWQIQLPVLISNDIALCTGIVSGLLISALNLTQVKPAIAGLQKAALFFLNRIFVRVLPLFILGFILKIQHEEMLAPILRDYAAIFCIIALCVYSYLLFIYGAVNGFRPADWAACVRNMLPAAITGFSAMSSAAAMPLVLAGSERNVKDPQVVRSAVPMVINIHLIGCDFAIPMLSLAIMTSFGMDLPTLSVYIVFAARFMAAKFAVAAVPAGGIIVMLPVLERHLGFTPEMLSLITALYILFDPLITSANVMGNGGFVMVFSKIRAFLTRPSSAL